MAANIGGIASKLGNRYEAKWLVRQLLEVLGATAAWVKYEGIGEEFLGFEFALHRRGRTEWHQAKTVAPNGNWTVRALGNEGVLSAFRARLQANNEDICVFVSQDPVKDLRSLIQKAVRANSEEEFDRALTDPERDKINQLEILWSTNRQATISWLRRCDVRTHNESTLDEDIATFSDLHFDRSADTFAVLRDYLEQNFNKTITTERLREELRSSGTLGLKHWSLDPTLIERLSTETRAYLATYAPFGSAGAHVPRKEVARVTELLLGADPPAVVLLTGVAGCGKSGIVRGLLEDLQTRKVLHLAMRVDHHLEKTSPQQFGQAVTGRVESPAATLKGLCPGEPTVLVVDQVDAISEVSAARLSMGLS